MTEESAVKVCVRVRPLIAREENAALENTDPVQLFWKADKKSIHQIDDGNSTKSFSFDRVFTAEETTNQLYQDIAKPLVVSSVEGYNGTIFAYGQTSSGKTFTMMGSDRIPGVIPLAVEDVFQTIKNCPKKEFLLRVSYMEIYNETVTDLLVDSWKRKPLEVRETINKNIYVADLTEELVTSPAQALAWIRKGEKNRHYGKTKMNQRSSRSHTIFRMILESRERSDPASGENADGAIIVSHLNLVDLAGSERASQTGAEGTRFKEGCNINRSLFTLGQVIKKLTDESQKGFTNYRDSKLTRILQNSLGGNAKTVIICTITPVTLDETLSTLQFASTAKKMKNDPHVTEVSDDGALLKRYRNEIVDLKRRLHEVSSVTQTTATEKEVLSQLLQEKDQLQREQEDRIKNLTKLLVTSSNLVPVKKMPKRRVTWGGKMLRFARPSACVGASSDLSFAESFTLKRKADRSCLMELGEDDEDFDSRWEIPDEPSDEMEMSQSSVTTRSFGDSPNDFVSPEGIRDLSGKVSNLELQLEMESQQKEEAMTKIETLDGRVAELELQLQTEAQQKHETVEKIHSMEQRAAELELQLQTEAQQKHETVEKIHSMEQRAVELELQLQTETQQKHEAMEKVEMLEFRMADLERRLEEQCDTQSETQQMRREFAETIELCEHLASEKDVVLGERDNLKQEQGLLKEQIESLEKNNAALSQELEEKREMDEFKSLEEEFKKEHEIELQNEISCLKKTIESSKVQFLELQKKIETLSEELKKKSDFAEELQSMSGKDLVQEVATLRRSLDDAEGISRDTKKEWAVLRSQNIALEETVVTLTAGHEKMDTEVNSLRFQLEAEKSRCRMMQCDLQKELKVVFDENTKLTTLLDGKVPKNLIDSVELERAVANLNKELIASREAEAALRVQLEDLASYQALPDKVDNLMKEAAETQVVLHSLQDELQEQRQKNSDLVKLCEQKDSDMLSLSQELQCVRDEKDNLLMAGVQSSAEEKEELLSTVASLTAERDQLKMDLQENVEMMIDNQEELRTVLEKNREQKERLKQLETAQTSKLDGPPSEMSAQQEELQTHLKTLAEELESVRAERNSLLSERMTSMQTHSEEVEKLLCRVTTLSEERDQLQEILEGLRQEKQQLRAELEDRMEMVAQAHSEFNQPEMLPSELQVRDEAVTQLQQEIEQLQATLQVVSEQKSQLEDDLQRNVEMATVSQSLLHSLQQQLQEQNQRYTDLERQSQETQAQLQQQVSETQCLQHSLQEELQEQKQKSSDHMKLCEQRESDLEQQAKTLSEQLESARAERDDLLFKKETVCQNSTEEVEKLLCRVTTLSEERDQLQEILEGLRQEKQQLRAELEDRMEMVAQAHSEFNQPEMLPSELQVRDEAVTQLQQEIEQLQATLQVVSEQKSQLEDDLQRNVEMATVSQSLLHSLQQQLQEQNQRYTDLERQSQETQAQLQQQVSETQCLQHSLQEELQEQKQMSSDHMKLCEQRESDLEQQAKTLSEQLESARAERDDLLFKKETVCQNSTEEVEKLLCRVTTLSEERDQLQEILEGLRQEKQQLRAELEDRMEMVAQAHSEFNQPEMLPSELQVRDEAVTQLQQEIEQLQATLQVVSEQKSQLEDDLQRNVEMATVSQSLLHSLQQQLQEQNQRYTDLERQSQETQAQLQQQVSETQCLQHSLQEELQEQKQMSSDHMKLCEQRESDLEQQAKTLSEQLESARAERDDLLFKKETVCQNSAEEVEKLLCRVTTLSEERDQLQEILEGLRQEKQQLRAELEDRMETLQTEIAQLSTCLQNVTEQKRQLEDDVQYNMNMVSTTQELLTSVQEELCEQKQMNTDLEKLSQEKECSLDQQMRTVTEKLESIEAERDSLLSEKEASCQRSAEEMEKLLCRVTTLSEERDQLQEILEGLRQEKQQLRAELEDRMEMMQQLEQQLQMSREKQSCVAAQRDASQQLLSEANTTISALQEQLSSLDQSTSAVKETALSRLQDSTGQIQESFRRFQHFIDTCSKYNSSGLVSALKAQCFLKQSYLTSLPKPTMNAYTTVCQLGLQTFQSLGNFMEHLKVQAQLYRNLFEELVKKDLAVFEERRLQDVLLCRVEAPSYSVKDEDFHTLWEHRLTELLDKRHLYLQKMVSISEKLWANMASFPSELSVESREREKFKEQVQAMFTNQPISFSRLDRILSCELDRRSAVLHSRKMTLQGIIDEQNGLFKELKLLEAQADAQLSSERSKSFTLLKAMEGAPLKTELSLLKDNQRLSLQLQQTEEKVKALFAQNEQLEDTQVRASDVVSNHKQATQLLQTELQDSRAQVEERENTIQTLRSKLQEFEKSTSGAELEKLQNKLFKVEVELSSASDKHQQEIQRMTTLLNEKEGSLRKLKETLRKSQQQGEESFLQGEDLHARLTNPRGLVIKSSIVLEKTKLEEETKQLQLKIAELDSLVSSQQAEISKWKSRAIKLKGRSTAEVEKPSSPCTVTKRGLPMNSDSSNLFSSPKKLLVTPKKVLDSPRKVLESPKFSLLDSPKSRFFDVAGSSELMSRTCPKQFFDNSGLGTIPDAAVGADRKEEWWPKSPKQEDMCKTQ
ncbi:centromere-associated protein E isoform X2 [Chelmon rostratus]|uniref:centromere-associated protein E isoform X2 n=1 Tax=Chelmon rostratus TaxID=109905 RepID=UPI001BE694C6|nr:centromere-associated protein E isoform X2 [Chelmon rostratus]